jgi:hypothetical protein
MDMAIIPRQVPSPMPRHTNQSVPGGSSGTREVIIPEPPPAYFIRHRTRNGGVVSGITANLVFTYGSAVSASCRRSHKSCRGCTCKCHGPGSREVTQ